MLNAFAIAAGAAGDGGLHRLDRLVRDAGAHPLARGNQETGLMDRERQAFNMSAGPHCLTMAGWLMAAAASP